MQKAVNRRNTPNGGKYAGECGERPPTLFRGKAETALSTRRPCQPVLIVAYSSPLWQGSQDTDLNGGYTIPYTPLLLRFSAFYNRYSVGLLRYRLKYCGVKYSNTWHSPRDRQSSTLPQSISSRQSSPLVVVHEPAPSQYFKLKYGYNVRTDPYA